MMQKMTFSTRPTALMLSLLTAISAAVAADTKTQTELEPWQQAEKTEVWEPVPAVVSAPQGKVPSDAIILIGDNDLSDTWEGLKTSGFPWQYENGIVTVTPGTGDIKTKADFCDVQVHLEWRTPTEVEDMQGQQRNNSGLFFQQRYEVQILDSYQNSTYPNGQAASVYKQTIPLVNAMRAPGEWQTYDIIYQAPRFDGETLSTPAYVTVLHNGVVVQNHTEIKGTTEWIGAPKYKAHACAPFQLQDHGNLVSFRNMWVRKLD